MQPGKVILSFQGERGGSVVECRTLEREVGGSKPTAAVLCPWARHFTPRKYWLITQEAMAPTRHDWKIVDWDVKPQHKQTNKTFFSETFWTKMGLQTVRIRNHLYVQFLLEPLKCYYCRLWELFSGKLPKERDDK